MPPEVVVGSLKVLEILKRSTELRLKLEANTKYFRAKISNLGLDVKPGSHPIVPIMLYDAHLAKSMAEKMLIKGVFVTGFSFPVVPRDQARIRVQISAAHSRNDLDFALEKFAETKKELGI